MWDTDSGAVWAAIHSLRTYVRLCYTKPCMRYVVIILIVLVIGIGLGWFGWTQGWFSAEVNVSDDSTATSTDESDDTDADSGDDDNNNNDDDSSDEADDQSADDEQPSQEVIGTSVNGHDITAHHFGSGDNEVVFVGGIHGGYSANTALVAYEMIDHFQNNDDVIPSDVSVTVIPALNPDGLDEVVGSVDNFSEADIPSAQSDRIPGRFNGNSVDLNRNFACNWQDSATWQEQSVNPGDSAFSEPESQALRSYVQSASPSAVAVYYSAAGAVYSSSCNEGALSRTQELMDTYASGSGYPAKGTFDAYEITGDATDWMAKEGIPAISVLLSDHTSPEWSKNKGGVEAILQEVSQ